jgi:ring-1,2-phenylacetyl-CoA epoxidase subunit PaaE
LIKTVLHQFAHCSVVLVYSNAAVEKAIYLTELQDLEVAFAGRFYFEALFSNTPDLSKARLHRDLIFSFLEQYVGTATETTYFYICGPESYMRLCTYTLQERGIAPALIRKENFYFHELAKRDAVPPDKEDHAATLFFDSQQYQVNVRYPDSILKAAKKAGLHLPYSCEAGRCGNCVARCTKGIVWHSYNEVLTEKELRQGLVLTCVGHPVGGDITLEI